MSETVEPSSLPDEFVKYKTDFFHFPGFKVLERGTYTNTDCQAWNSIQLVNLTGKPIRVINRLGISFDIPPNTDKYHPLVKSTEVPCLLIAYEIGHGPKVKFNTDGTLNANPKHLELFEVGIRWKMDVARIAYAIVPEETLSRHGRTYVSAFDLYLIHETHFDESSTHPLADRQFDWMMRTETDALRSTRTCALAMRMVNSAIDALPRYANINGIVYKLLPHRNDPVTPNGLYIHQNGTCAEDHHRIALKDVEHHTLQEMDDLPYIFKTYDEAFAYDPVKRAKLELELLKSEIEKRKQELESRKIDFEEESLKRKAKMEEDKSATDTLGNAGKIVDTVLKTITFAFQSIMAYLKFKAA